MEEAIAEDFGFMLDSCGWLHYLFKVIIPLGPYFPVGEMCFPTEFWLGRMTSFSNWKMTWLTYKQSKEKVYMHLHGLTLPYYSSSCEKHVPKSGNSFGRGSRLRNYKEVILAKCNWAKTTQHSYSQTAITQHKQEINVYCCKTLQYWKCFLSWQRLIKY